LQSATPDVSSRQRHGGFLVNVHDFDCAAFVISPTEVLTMDPQQRLVLELGHNVIYALSGSSGVPRSPTGVFIGITFLAFEEELKASPAGSTVYATTGSSLSAVSGRLSFTLGIHGPCISIDTACSAALAACHLGSAAMRASECDCAVSAGVNLMLSPTVSARFALAGMTSLSGRCCIFDARADGYSRSEACSGLALNKQVVPSTHLSASCVRQDGRSASLTAPNGSASVCCTLQQFPERSQITWPALKRPPTVPSSAIQLRLPR